MGSLCVSGNEIKTDSSTAKQQEAKKKPKTLPLGTVVRRIEVLRYLNVCLILSFKASKPLYLYLMSHAETLGFPFILSLCFSPVVSRFIRKVILSHRRDCSPPEE